MNQWLDSYQISWLYNWDITETWLDFDDLDLIFEVTVVEKLKIHDEEGGGGEGGRLGAGSGRDGGLA